MPGCRYSATVRVAWTTAARSGPPSSASGVGTQITATSVSVRTLGRWPPEAPGEHRLDGLVGEVVDDARVEVVPATARPARVASSAKGRPTWPKPSTTRSTDTPPPHCLGGAAAGG